MDRHAFMRLIRRALITAAAIIITAACASRAAEDAPQKADIVSIFTALDERPGDAGTIAALEGYVNENPQGEAVDEALLRLGRIRAGAKDWGGASASLQRLLTDWPGSRFKFDALYDLAAIRLKTGHSDDAKSLLETVATSAEATATLRARARSLLKTPAPQAADNALKPQKNLTPAIGALLPLKGQYAQYGADALKGIMLAAGVFGQTGRPVEVFTRDLGPEAGAEAAVTELAANAAITGIVGPLLSSTALDAAKAAQDKKIPIIALSQREGLTDAGDYVFRNFLTPQAQAAYLAEYACKVMGKKNFVILYPQNNYGAELAKHFSTEIIKDGCSVAASVSYPTGATDFGQQMRQAFAVKVKERKEGRRVIKEYTPGVTADAVYIPDSFETAALAAPYLEYYNITGVQLLGSNAWNSPKLAQLGGKQLEGAVFVDGFFADSARTETQAFVARFREVYGVDPGVIEAEAYDAAMMLITGMDAAKTDRQAGASRLRSLKDWKGATGDLSLSNGDVKRRLFLLTVKNGRIIEVGAAPHAEQDRKAADR
ncbi:MAG: penicillin-binding protein activator [Deltaproteobacteria bacterium]|nr:penicillin-binding protein activator [Deltaproteobacteria bacterium]